MRTWVQVRHRRDDRGGRWSARKLLQGHL